MRIIGFTGMKRFLSVILIIGSLSGAFYAASAMGSMSMSHDGMSTRMDCGSASCAAPAVPSAPDQDCVDHCLAAATAPAIPVSPIAAGLVAVAATLVIFAFRSVVPSIEAVGAPPHLGPSLRVLALAGIVMRN